MHYFEKHKIKQKLIQSQQPQLSSGYQLEQRLEHFTSIKLGFKIKKLIYRYYSSVTNKSATVH